MSNEEKLIRMLKYVSEHNDFYKKRIRDYGITNPLDITQWPVLTRKELQENRYNMFSDGYKSKYFNQQLRRQSSSGSTGMPVNVYWDYKDWYASNMCLWRKRLEWYGIHPNDKCVVFTLAAINCEHEGQTLRFINKPDSMLSLNVSLINDSIGWNKVAQLINDFSPRWLQIQPFILNKLVQLYQETAIPIPSSLKYIESVGELLLPDIKIKSEEYFNVPIVNLYGTEEMNGIAFECPHHHMHVLDDNVYIEVDIAGKICGDGEGASIVTSLKNYALPLIRYNQCDRINLDKGTISCQRGYKSPIINLILGRISESILINNKIEINPFMLAEIIIEVNNRFKDIINAYKYVYDRDHSCLSCYINLSEKNMAWYDNIKKDILEAFKQKISRSVSLQFEVFHISEESLYSNKNKVVEIIGATT